MTDKLALPVHGLVLDTSGGGGGPVPITKNITFGHNGDITGVSTDTFGNMYLLYNAPGTSTTDEPAFMRAFTGDVLKKVSIAVGASATGTVTVGLYSADDIDGDWTLVQKIDIAAAPAGTNLYVEQAVNITLIKGKYYFLGVNSATVELVQLAATGGFKRWTAAAGVAPATLADVDSSGSAYVAYLYGTVERTTNP